MKDVPPYLLAGSTCVRLVTDESLTSVLAKRAKLTLARERYLQLGYSYATVITNGIIYHT